MNKQFNDLCTQFITCIVNLSKVTDNDTHSSYILNKQFLISTSNLIKWTGNFTQRIFITCTSN